MRLPRSLLSLCALATAGWLAGCAGTAGFVGNARFDPLSEPRAGVLISEKAFAKDAVNAPARVEASMTAAGAAFQPRIVLYHSSSTASYLDSVSVNASHRIEQWEVFLKKYRLPFTTASTVSAINGTPPGVLILPSSLALSQSERQAIVDWRARGGSVLSTWATGVRDQNGNWLGFDFMAKALDAQVVGSSAAEKEDNFINPIGDGPVLHSLPAGQRIWTERPKEWLPLRIQSAQPLLHIMDWSRSFHDKRTTSIASWNERNIGSTVASRSLTLGFPERLWLSADAKTLDAILFDSVRWLMRLPSAQVAAWPAPYKAALLMVMDGVEILVDTDLAYLKHLEQAGVRATFYAIGENVPKSLSRLKKLVGQGHELAIQGDRFNGFRGQAAEVQDKRIAAAIARIKEAGVALPTHPGFHAPTESYDQQTLALIRRRGFSHVVATQDVTESRLPLILPPEPNAPAGSPPLVLYPRTQRGPEDATEEGDVEDGLKSFYAELALSINMHGLAIVRQPNQGLLPLDNLVEVAAELAKYKGKVWMPTAGELSKWWLERARVSAHVEGSAQSPQLAVTVHGPAALSQPVTVMVHLPWASAGVSLTQSAPAGLKIVPIDAQRTALVFPNLAAGAHRWPLTFTNPHKP